MPTLSSLLVQREAASMRAVEEAIARQVLHGGDLATNLLELSAVREEVLLSVLGEAHGMPSVPPGRFEVPGSTVIRIVPGELALRHGVFPLELVGRTLLLATSEPLSVAVEDDLSFALDVAIVQRIALLVRIRQAIAEAYAIPLDRRFMRLTARLEGRPDPNPSSAPPPDRAVMSMKMPRPISIPAPSFGTGLRSTGTGRPPILHTPVVGGEIEPMPMPAIPRDRPAPLALDALTPTPEPAAPRGFSDAPGPPTIADFSGPSMAPGPAPEPAQTTDVSELAPAAQETEPEPGEAEPEAPKADPTAGRASPKATKKLAGWVQRALRDDRTKAHVDKASPRDLKAPKGGRRKGPFTAAMAEDELEQAAAAEEVFDVLFSFSQQYFEYSALFVVQVDLAEGRDAHGPGADRAKIAGIGVPLDLPSVFATARDRRAPVIGRFSASGLDTDIARDLGRSPEKRACLVLPVVVRARTVAILYGDDGESDVSLPSVGDVISMAGLAASAVERIVLRRKLGANAPPPLKPRARARVAEASPPFADVPARAAALPQRPPTSPTIMSASPLAPKITTGRGGIEALARAFELPGAKKPMLPDAKVPTPQVSPGAESVRFPPAGAASSPAPRGSDPAGARDARNTLDFAEALSEDAAMVASDELTDAEGSESPADAAQALSSAVPPPPRLMPRLTQPGLGVPQGSLDDPALEAEWPSLRRLPSVPPPEDGADDPFESDAAPSDSPPAPKVDRDKATVVSRRGPAPTFEGRGRPLPESSPAPPPSALLRRNHPTKKPIPREEQPESPTADAFVAAMDASPAGGARPRSVPPLPSIIVDVAAEYASLLQRMIEGGPGSQDAFAELVRHGEQAVQVLMAKFPGPLRVDRHRARDQLPAASQCGPLLELLVAIRKPALPFVTVRTSSPDVEVRFWATHVLGELRFAEAANALVPRLFDDDVSVRRVARRSAAALVGAGDAGTPILQGLDHMTQSSDQPIRHRVLAIETMGEIRSGAMVPPLIAVLADVADEVADAARRALLLITRQDFGREARRWSDWWTKNQSRNRIEWLIDALMHDQPAIRRAAGDELKQLTKEYFGYYDDLPKKERERAHGLYRAWWEREGRQRFS